MTLKQLDPAGGTKVGSVHVDWMADGDTIVEVPSVVVGFKFSEDNVEEELDTEGVNEVVDVEDVTGPGTTGKTTGVGGTEKTIGERGTIDGRIIDVAMLLETMTDEDDLGMIIETGELLTIGAANGILYLTLVTKQFNAREPARRATTYH